MELKHYIPGGWKGRAIQEAVNNSNRGWISECVPLPGRCDGRTTVLFGAPGLLNAEAGVTLPFRGVAAVLEYVLAAGEVCTVGGFLSTASLGNKHAVLL